jgi:hypothetical protein
MVPELDSPEFIEGPKDELFRAFRSGSMDKIIICFK